MTCTTCGAHYHVPSGWAVFRCFVCKTVWVWIGGPHWEAKVDEKELAHVV